MQPVLHSALILVLACALLASCSSRPDAFILPGETQQLPRQEAERRLIEKSLSVQLSRPLDSPLELRRVDLPAYPPDWKRLTHVPEKSVRIEFTVSPSGDVTNPVAVGNPDPELLQRSLAALQMWKFGPLSSGGKPASLRLSFLFVFRLDD